MSVEIIHDFVSPVADAPESPDEVTPSRWNAPHVLTQAEGSLLGRIDSGVGPTTELTPAEVRTLINVADGATANAGIVVSVVAGSGVTVDATDPAHPIVAAAGGGSDFFSTSENVTTAASPMWTASVNDIANRTTYDDELTGFTILVYPDVSNSNKPTTYTKLSDTTADWGPAVTIAQIDPSKYITYVTTSGSASSEPLFLTTSVDLDGNPIAGLEVTPGVAHVVVFKTKTDPFDDKVFLVGNLQPDPLTLSVEATYALLTADGGAEGGARHWDVQNSTGSNFSYETFPETMYPLVRVLNGGGGAEFHSNQEFVDFYKTSENLAGPSTCDPNVFISFVSSDGSAGPNSISLAPSPLRPTAPKYIIFDGQTDPADTLVIDPSSVVGGETITLTGPNAWVVYLTVWDKYLPWAWGNGATTDYVGTRTLQLADTGELSWV
jgi:hypothetical protein